MIGSDNGPIVGIHHSGPLSSAAVIRGGSLIAGAVEERFTRVKMDRTFPHQALRFCLDAAGATAAAVDCFAIGWNAGENAALKYRAGFSDWMRFPGEWLASVPNQLLPAIGRPIVGSSSSFFDDEGHRHRIRFVDHHLAHAHLALAVSGFDDCAILVADGWSEQKTTSWMHARAGRIETLAAESFPQSIGCFYAAITDWLGYRPLSDEWKVMGMAAYGRSEAVPEMCRLIELLADGRYELDLRYFDFYNFDRPRFFSPKLEQLLGRARQPGEPVHQRHFDVAAAAQQLFARVMTHTLTWLAQATGSPNVCLTGGVAMNCLFNATVASQTPFSRVHVSFAPDDSGNAIGAALAVAAEQGRAVALTGQTSAIGVEYTDEQIGDLLERYKLRARSWFDVAGETAQLLAAGQVVGWFQGRAEFGQRALGHRSILASPAHPAMKDRLNSAVKYREAYRPFAPMVQAERAGCLFEMDGPDPVRYMEKAPRWRDSARRASPAAVHEDGTGRVQAVVAAEEPLVHELLAAFTKLTDCPALINTSFNLNGEPIVNSPDDAIRTFMTSGMDALVIGGYVLEKDRR